MWSLGLEYDKPEHSIGNAYLDLIENAKEFIYIENQFFISERNGVAEAIAHRIIRAYENK
jgi:phospholipase D1/2